MLPLGAIIASVFLAVMFVDGDQPSGLGYASEKNRLSEENLRLVGSEVFVPKLKSYYKEGDVYWYRDYRKELHQTFKRLLLPGGFYASGEGYLKFAKTDNSNFSVSISRGLGVEGNVSWLAGDVCQLYFKFDTRSGEFSPVEEKLRFNGNCDEETKKRMYEKLSTEYDYVFTVKMFHWIIGESIQVPPGEALYTFNIGCSQYLKQENIGSWNLGSFCGALTGVIKRRQEALIQYVELSAPSEVVLEKWMGGSWTSLKFFKRWLGYKAKCIKVGSAVEKTYYNYPALIRTASDVRYPFSVSIEQWELAISSLELMPVNVAEGYEKCE